MDAIEQARAFLSIAETGGFSSAARQLNVAPSVVTKRIGQLESEIGRQLFVRTTRRVELTSTGKHALNHARDLVLAYESMTGHIVDDASELSGRLRVKAPSALTYLHLARIINRFLIKHTKVSLELLLIDRPVNPVTESFDLVITGLPSCYDQIDEIPLFPIRRLLFASPHYLRRKGMPMHAEDLAHHQCLQYSYPTPGVVWSLTGARGQVNVTVNSTFSTNDINVMLQGVIDGRGIGILPDYIAYDAIASDQIVQVLKDFSLPEFWFRAQRPKAHRHHRLLGALIEHIRQELAGLTLTVAATS